MKVGPFSRELRKYHNELIIHTGQHFDEEMSDLFFRDLEIPRPDFNLNINGGTHGQQTSQMISSIENILMKEKTQLVVVFGDTNSTLAGALATVKLGIPCLHIEAGLRSFNRSMPEEINRIVADHTSDILFAPTSTAMLNIEKEGLTSKAFLTGDIMVDSLNWGIKKAKDSTILDALNLKSKQFSLLTLHRPYNVDDPLKLTEIINQLGKLSRLIVFPIHPRTKSIIENNKISIPSNFILSKPLGYLDFIKLQDNSIRIITDSGGIQKEAFLLKKPCITLRSETEWVETVSEGWNLLLDAYSKDLVDRIESFLPTHISSQIFGSEVAQKMVSIINSQIRG
ncbi:MAG TPA: UDP-N-acetylglucosamine 2-epimerase (non-hydrolyzing) [Bacteroidales bacterium]|nr:UDP-N-acetylglucosamine 2-epimerase (non-hydrolyzing) [Bacteroidales bacterium]